MILANKIQSDAENFKLLVREGDRFCKVGSVMRLLLGRRRRDSKFFPPQVFFVLGDWSKQCNETNH